MPDAADVTRQMRSLLKRGLHSIGENTGIGKPRIATIIIESDCY